MIGGDAEAVVGFEGGGVRFGWRDVKFAPEGVDVFLVVGEALVLHEVVSCGGVGTIGANEEVEADLDFLFTWFLAGGVGVISGLLGLEPCPVLLEVGSR